MCKDEPNQIRGGYEDLLTIAEHMTIIWVMNCKAVH